MSDLTTMQPCLNKKIRNEFHPFKRGTPDVTDGDLPADEKLQREQLVALYTRLANAPESDFGWGKGKDNARQLGYDDEWLAALPDAVWESAAAVGNPFAIGAIMPGETVVDLGCGAGADVCVAALLVGAQGTVIGIDCTPAMIEKASANAALAGLGNARFQQAEISRLPLPDSCAEVVISNGAINLAQDKTAALAEAFRVLRPGGRMHIADMVRDPSNTEASCGGEESWADCVSGCLQPQAFLSLIEQAGFHSVALLRFTGYKTAASTIGALIVATKPGECAQPKA